jgi:hypothetical protein
LKQHYEIDHNVWSVGNGEVRIAGLEHRAHRDAVEGNRVVKQRRGVHGARNGLMWLAARTVERDMARAG